MKNLVLACAMTLLSLTVFSQWQSNLGVGVNEPQYKLDVDGDINISSGHNFLIDGIATGPNNPVWMSNPSGIFYDQGSVVIGENYVMSYDSVKLFVRNTYKVQFDAGNYGSGELKLLLQARNGQKSMLQFATGYRSNDFITYSNGEFHIAQNNSPVGIGTTTPTEQLDVFGNIKISDENSGIILKSPDGTEWKITIDNDGNLESSLYSNVNQTKENKLVNDKVKIYPNPAATEINIEISDQNLLSGFIEIYNLSGSAVFMKKFSSTSFKIDISDFEAGSYFIKLKDENKNLITSEKIIVL